MTYFTAFVQASKTPPENHRRIKERLKQVWAKDPLRQGLLSVFDQGIVSGTNFATSVLIGRLCSHAEMGLYALGLSIVYFARAIQEQVVSAPYTIYVNRKPESQRAAFAGSSTVHFGGFAGLVVLCLLGFAGVLASQESASQMLPLILILAAALPLFLLREFIRHFTFSHLKMGTALLLDAAVSLIQLCTLGLFAWFGVLTVPVVFAVMGGSCLLASLGWFWTKTERFEISRSAAIRDWKGNWGFVRWALACQLVGCSAPYVMPWFVASMEGTAATGLLAASTTLVGLANMFVMGVANFLSPRAAKAYAEGGVMVLKDVIVTTGTVFAVTLGVFSLLMCFLGGNVAALVYGETYRAAGPVMAVLAFGLLATGLGVTAGNGLWAIDKPQANFRADVCALIATIILSALLIGPYGVMGAALATTLGAAVDALIRGGILFHEMRRLKLAESLSPKN
jgi:O-antigen/teichoic acid export membrane protein